MANGTGFALEVPPKGTEQISKRQELTASATVTLWVWGHSGTPQPARAGIPFFQEECSLKDNPKPCMWDLQ